MLPTRAIAFTDGSGWVAVSYLTKILVETIKNYEQLRMILQQARNQEDLLRTINRGIENSMGLIQSLPIKDNRVLDDLNEFYKSYGKVVDLYGKIPKSKEQALQTLQDQMVAESLQMTSNVQGYSKIQEENALKIFVQARDASPKGAARMEAQTSAQILHTLNQLLKLNGQMLKLQSQQLAGQNKFNKESVSNFQHVDSSFKKNFNNLKTDLKLPQF